MTTKSNKIQNIWFPVSVYLFFIVIGAIISSNIFDGIQLVFSKDNNSSMGVSKLVMCPQIAYSGPTYTGPNGCPAPCPTNTLNPPSGCPQQSSLTTNNSLPIKIKSNK